MPTVAEVFERNRSLFGRVPSVSNNYVCRFCLGPVSGYAQCYDCYELFINSNSPASLRRRVVPITACINPSPWFYRLYTYKRFRPEYCQILGALAWTYLENHRGRITDLLGGEPSITTIVPSTRGDSYEEQRFREALCMVPPLAEELTQALRHVDDTEVPHREYAPDAFTSGPADVEGHRVLLLEDTWITGATAMSAAGALLRDGARSVAILPLARSSQEDCDETYQEAMAREYDPSEWPRGT